MKTFTNFSLLALAFLLVSCNEKVSPQLQEGNSTSSTTSGSGSGSGPTIVPDEYYFRVTNTSPTILNFKLHQTGIGNATKACEVKSTSKLSSDNFRGAPALNDITCFFEAEELSLFHGGFSVQMEASPNTCDFVGYSPYGFYDKIPGDSSGNYIQITCANDTTNSTHVATAADGTHANLDISLNGGGSLGCNGWASTDIASGNRNAFSPSNDEELCRFNYEDDKCDIGEINVSEFVVTYTPPGDDPATQPAILKYETVNRVVKCGGSIPNCVKGPTKEIDSSVAKVIEITQSEYDKEVKVEYKYDTLTGKQISTKSYANFRRDLANTQLDYVSSDGLTGSYLSAFSDPSFGKIFDPKVLDYYAANVRMDRSDYIVNDAMTESWTVVNNTYRAKPLAADPYLGTAMHVNPFYTFYCYDTAMDIKARVRMMVRDWDRVFPANSDLELISDIYKGSNARQDIINYVELPDDLDPTIPFDDLRDWDDHIPMDRTPGAYDPTTTIWSPTPTATYTDGWFNPENFTWGDY